MCNTDHIKILAVNWAKSEYFLFHIRSGYYVVVCQENIYDALLSPELSPTQRLGNKLFMPYLTHTHIHLHSLFTPFYKRSMYTLDSFT